MGSNSRKSATDRTLNRPDRTRPVVPTVAAANYRSDAASVRSPATGRVRSQFRALGTSLYSIGRCVSTSGRLPPASGPCVRSPICRATGPVSGRASSVRSPLRARFFAILRTAWFLSSCLDCCLISWIFSYAPKVLLKVLIIRSSRCLCPSHVLHPIELQNNYLQIH